MSHRLCPMCGMEWTDPVHCTECGYIQRTPEQVEVDLRAFVRPIGDGLTSAEIEVVLLMLDAIDHGDPLCSADDPRTAYEIARSAQRKLRAALKSRRSQT